MNFQPVIKWSGSKRSQANEILKYFPREIDTYYEPFVGGGSMFRALLESDIKVKHYVCSDLNSGLIDLWNCIKSKPMDIYKYYKELWGELNADSDFERKKAYFNSVRERYNKEHNPLDFMFIMRTTTNGMPRYNIDGEFNNSFHVTRNGIVPETLRDILVDWSIKINDYDVEFDVMDYGDVVTKKQDLLYLDHPYAHTKGMYFGNFDIYRFFDFLRRQECPYVLSFDGKSGDEDNTFDVPEELYDKHVYLKSGNSSFKRVIGINKDAMVYESLYVKNIDNDMKSDNKRGLF